MYNLTVTVNYPTTKLGFHNERRLELKDLVRAIDMFLDDPAATSFVFVIAKYPKEA